MWLALSGCYNGKHMNTTEELLTRGVVDVFVKQELEEALRSKKKLRIYYGVDPSGPVIHLGHAVLLRKLELLQELGHKIIFLIGDFTGMIGDPTDRSAVRQPLTRQEVLKNAKTYKKQVAHFLDFAGKNPAEIKFNSKWNDSFSFKNLIELSARFTVQQLLERDMFKKRLAEAKSIGLHEFLYPVIQGYDAVMLDADVQLGGTDQTFNMLQGRHLMKSLKNKAHMVMTCELLEGTDGRKMSKSFGNVIAIDDAPNDMFGKVMSITDGLIKKYFILATQVPLQEIDAIIRDNKNPRDQKLILAEKITELYHGENKASAAKQAFVSQFSKGRLPTDIQTKKMSSGIYNYTDLLVAAGLAASKSDARRLIEQNGVKVDQKTISQGSLILDGKHEFLMQVGKRKFLKIK